MRQRDPVGSPRTSSDWTISISHGHPSAISQFRWYHIIKPLSVSTHLHSAKHSSGVISIEYLVYFWICLTFFVIPFVLFHHAQPFYPCFIFSLRQCAPLVYSFPDSSPDVSLFISLTAPHAFIHRWFIHSHDPLQFRFAHKLFPHSLSPLFPYLFLSGQMFPNMGEQ